ncbi:hypothetical protein, partial [Leptospira sp. id769339]|uniref:hypothetical protein n=1 Tax=Leptospira sp. id769339 TaxID=2864221 RepID=UPI00214C8F67
VCLQAKLDCVLLKFFIVLRFTGHAGFILFSCIPVSTKSGEVHLLLHKHLNHCQSCQRTVIEYSEREKVPVEVFDKDINELKALWYGPEIHNEDLIEISSETDNGSVLNRLFRWLLKYKKPFLLIGYFAIIFNLIILFKRSFY